LDIRLWGALLVLLLPAACAPGGGQGASKAPDFARAAVKSAASGATLTDFEFDASLSNASVRAKFGARADEIIDTLHRSRAKVASQRKAPSLRSPERSQMVLLAVVAPESMPSAFGELLAGALDDMTSSAGGTRPSNPNPYQSSEEGPTTRTTTTLTEKDELSAAGSRVQLTMHWTYRMTTVEKASGASLLDATDDRILSGAIDVCPSAAGMVPASVQVNIRNTATPAGGETATRTTMNNNAFIGHVDDHAVLRQVTQGLRDESSWETPSLGRGGFLANASNINWPAGESGLTLGGLDISAAQGSLSLSGDAQAAEVNQLLGWSMNLDVLTINAPIKEAQQLWRHGRCVVVTAPDYKAETPLSVADQEKMQHDVTVDKGSTTRFGANLRHRFGGGLNQPVTAKLTSGAKKLEPGQLRSVPATLSYTAPDEADKKATVQLNSVSKRGVGTLVLGFNTGAARLNLTIKGTSRTTISNFYVAGGATIGPVEFTKKDDTTWEGNAPFQGNFDSEPWVGECTHATSTETGSAYLTATIDKSADPNVWVVHLGDRDLSYADVTVTCAGSSTRNPRDHTGATIGMLIQMGEIRIPIDGGTVPVHKSRTDPDVMYTVDATVTATVGKK